MFEQKKQRYQAVNFCLEPENKKIIMGMLNRLVKQSNLYNADTNEAFTYVLHYFEQPDKQFYKGIGDDNYSVEPYVFSNIPYAFNIYKSELLTKDNYYAKTTEFTEEVLNKPSEEKELELLESNLESLFLEYLDIHNFPFLKTHVKEIINNIFINPIFENNEDNLNDLSEKTEINVKVYAQLLENLKINYLNKDQLSVEIYQEIYAEIKRKKL